MISTTQKKYKKLATIVGIAIIAILGLIVWNYQQEKKNKAAHSEMFQSVYYFEAGDYEKALQGDGIYSGFLEIIKSYGFTKAANLARFYAGICYMHAANYEQAAEHLKQFSSKDFLLQARAWSLIGDALVEQKNYTEATKYYLKAADYKPNEQFSPTYLVKAAIAYEAQQDYQNALKCYQKIVEKYSKSSLYTDAKKYASRIEAFL